MSEQDELDLDQEFERSLANLRPAAGGLNVAELAFRAGRRSARHRRVWPALTGLLAVTQALTLALWLRTQGPAVVPPDGRTDPPAETPPPAPAAPPRLS